MVKNSFVICGITTSDVRKIVFSKS